MTTINNSQTTSIWTAPNLGNNSIIKNNVSRLKGVAARFFEHYRSGIENGMFYVSMP